jgi:beta-lactam-binding protein with PASTA domain
MPPSFRIRIPGKFLPKKRPKPHPVAARRVASAYATFMDRVRRILAIARTLFLRTAGGIVLLAVFVLAAFTALRIAIHGREVTVPDLANLSDSNAADKLKSLGLNLSVENRFYATAVPPNHVLSQSPVPGSRVRRGGQIRVTESLGTQQVAVPDVTAQDERPAEALLRHLQLDVGAVVHLPAPAPAGIVLAQSPPPNAAGLDGPRVALLVADDFPAPASQGYVMPSLIGLSVAEANQRLTTAGLHLASATSAPAPDDPSNPAAVPTHLSNLITSQMPLPGHRVTRADNIRVVLN